MWSGTHLVTYTHTHTHIYASEQCAVIRSAPGHAGEGDEGREERDRGDIRRTTKKADLCVPALHSIPAALRQTVLAVGGQRILLVAVV